MHSSGDKPFQFIQLASFLSFYYFGKHYRSSLSNRSCLVKNLIFTFVLLLSKVSIANSCEIKTILAENTQSAMAVFSKIKEMIKTDLKLKNNLAMSELTAPKDNISLMYIADINNDGKKEYIFAAPGSGSGKFISIFIFEKVGDRFVFLGDPAKPQDLGDGPWYFNWYRDSKTHQIQFLVSDCDITYMQFDSGPDHKLNRYRWKNGLISRISVK